MHTCSQTYHLVFTDKMPGTVLDVVLPTISQRRRLMSKQYGFLVDLRRCVGCTSCQVSCKMENAVPMGKFRSKVDFAEEGKYPDAKRHFFPKHCNNCAEPPCITPCPVKGATYKRDDGVVMINRDLCIGCGRCISSCPYGARYAQHNIPVKNDPKPYAKSVKEVAGKSAKELKVADKCDYCSHRLAQGIEEPACVRNCPGLARIFGDLNDPNSQISKLVKELKTEGWHPEYDTKPRNSYVVVDKGMFTRADGEINK